MITQKRLKEVISYNPVSGLFTWVNSTSNRTKIKTNAGCFIKKTNRFCIGIDGKHYLSHRLAWLYVYGYMPKVIDHIDGNSLNNEIVNLRECTQAQNTWNSKINIKNTSGVKGVSFDKLRNKWTARVMCNGKLSVLGRFDNLESATIAVNAKRGELHENFARY